MRFFEVVISGAALLSTGFAATIDTWPNAIVAGETYEVTFSPADAQATFILRRGLDTNLDTVGPVGTATGGTFSWTVAEDLPNALDYALEIQVEGDEPNYSGQFPLTGGSGSLSSALASASSAASSAAASASSAMESMMSSITSVAASASAMPTPSGMNTTVSSATMSQRPTGTGADIPESTGAASSLSSSPLALIFGAAAAFFYLA